MEKYDVKVIIRFGEIITELDAKYIQGENGKPNIVLISSDINKSN